MGDGHDGVWNLVREFGQDQCSRCEILDWYHLKENLYKVGGSLKRLKSAETLLWQGQVEAAKTLFNPVLSIWEKPTEGIIFGNVIDSQSHCLVE